MGKQWKQWQTLFWGGPISLQMVTAAMKWKDACSLEEKLWHTPRQCVKKQRHYFACKCPCSQSYGFPVVMYSCKSWIRKRLLKNWCFRTMMLEKTFENPLHSKEIKPVNPKGNQPSIFIGRTDTEAETPILWPLDVKNWLTGKDSDAGKDWRQEEKGSTEDEIIR